MVLLTFYSHSFKSSDLLQIIALFVEFHIVLYLVKGSNASFVGGQKYEHNNMEKVKGLPGCWQWKKELFIFH